MVLERQRPVPLYYQLELHLREAIESGTFRPGDRMPAENELSRIYGVSRVTVREALRRLEEDGLLSRTPKRGTIILPQAIEGRKIERHPAHLLAFEEEILRHGYTPRVEVLSLERCPLPERIAALLQLQPEYEVVRVRRLGWADDTPLWVESRYLHPRYGDSVTMEELARVSLSAFMKAMAGLQNVTSKLRITAGAASVGQAKNLGIKPGDPVLINEFALYGDDGQPVEAARAAFRADRYAFSFETSSSDSGEIALHSLSEVSQGL
ncbi:MAG TPA: GntR family transcriptional regulator [Chloroflexota bacterium]|nr:GntR family transcriptional regulator [Chloroflexota bacterium]